MTSIVFHHGMLLADRQVYDFTTGDSLQTDQAKLHISDYGDFAYAVSGIADRRIEAYITIDITVRDYVSRAIQAGDNVVTAIQTAMEIHLRKAHYVFVARDIAIIKPTEAEAAFAISGPVSAGIGTGIALYRAIDLLEEIKPDGVEAAFKKVIKFDPDSSNKYDKVQQINLKKFKIDYVPRDRKE